MDAPLVLCRDKKLERRAGNRFGFAEQSRVVLCHRPGQAHLALVVASKHWKVGTAPATGVAERPAGWRRNVARHQGKEKEKRKGVRKKRGQR